MGFSANNSDYLDSESEVSFNTEDYLSCDEASDDLDFLEEDFSPQVHMSNEPGKKHKVTADSPWYPFPNKEVSVVHLG